VKENPGFNHTVKMWVFEEYIDGRKLTEIVNETHENVKYLKGFTIPNNVVSFYSSLVCGFAGVQLIRLFLGFKYSPPCV
jgi:glycerol-3-phosphate dehydrogenase